MWVPFLWLGALLAAGAVWFALTSAGWVSGPRLGGPYPPFWVLLPIAFFGFWVLVVLFVRPWGWWGGWGGWGAQLPGTSPEDVVRHRYARGEISRDEMVRLLGDLDQYGRRGPTLDGR